MDRENARIMVTTSPFGGSNNLPVKRLSNLNVHYNVVGRKYTREELLERLYSFNPNIIIAGTEKYTEDIIDNLKNLELIARVGIGLDSIPVEYCKEKGVRISYTPDAPSNAVAELTICQMLNMLRKVQLSDRSIRNSAWKRHIGRELRCCDIGIIGCGRIGTLVIEKLQGLKPRRIFVNDIIYDKAKGLPRCEFETKLQILSSCDIISIHIPFNEENENFISEEEFAVFKKDACIINMSRGGIINEDHLVTFLTKNPDASAAIDTFNDEPYSGRLCELENAFLTPHLGSCSMKSRFDMEVGAVESVLNYLSGNRIINEVI